MKPTLILLSAVIAGSITPAFARGHSHSYSSHSRSYSSHSRSYSSHSHSGYHEHFAKEVHQFRGGHMITIRPRHANALHFYSRH